MSGRLAASDLGTVVGVWAHPDDEAYLMAGSAMVAAAAGSHVACITATLGEAGETADEARWPRADLATVRRRELAASLDEMGIEDRISLGLPDGRLAAVHPEVGTRLLVDAFEGLRPDTVLTFGQDGMTGHPDHVAVAEWAERAAREVRGDACRVLAATRTREVVEAFAEVNREVYGDTPPPCAAAEEIVLEVRLTGDLLERKVRALRAQPSQTSRLVAWLGPEKYGAWVADELWVVRA